MPTNVQVTTMTTIGTNKPPSNFAEARAAALADEDRFLQHGGPLPTTAPPFVPPSEGCAAGSHYLHPR